MAKVKADAADALARAKAQSEEEVKVYTDALNRVEQEMQQAEIRQRVELEQKEIYYAEEMARVKNTIEEAKAQFEAQSKTYSDALIRAEEKATAEAERRAEIEEQLGRVLSNSETLGTCECCGKRHAPAHDLTRIDSGQLLCPDCFEALRG